MGNNYIAKSQQYIYISYFIKVCTACGKQFKSETGLISRYPSPTFTLP